MWREYSISYIKNNRASSISILAAAFISALFLSFLCSLFYGFWVYEVEGIILEDQFAFSCMMSGAVCPASWVDIFCW